MTQQTRGFEYNARQWRDAVKRAHDILNAYCPDASSDDHERLTDLLTDLMHWCDARNLNFTEALDSAQHTHYLNERRGTKGSRP